MVVVVTEARWLGKKVQGRGVPRKKSRQVEQPGGGGDGAKIR